MVAGSTDTAARARGDPLARTRHSVSRHKHSVDAGDHECEVSGIAINEDEHMEAEPSHNPALGHLIHEADA